MNDTLTAMGTKMGTGARPRTVYLSGSTNRHVEDAAELVWGELGLLVQPGNCYLTRLDRFPFWAADNGAVSVKGGVPSERAGFDPGAWFRWLEGIADKAPRESYLHELHGSGDAFDVRETCLFATAPDVVGNAAATLERSLPWLARIRGAGFPAAFVAQNGSELGDGLIPWGTFDVLFLGGSTDWKLGKAGAGVVVAEALRRGVPVHMGRVNSARRFAIAAAWGCASADGNFLTFGSIANMPRLAGWLDALEGTSCRRATVELEAAEVAAGVAA